MACYGLPRCDCCLPSLGSSMCVSVVVSYRIVAYRIASCRGVVGRIDSLLPAQCPLVSASWTGPDSRRVLYLAQSAHSTRGSGPGRACCRCHGGPAKRGGVHVTLGSCWLAAADPQKPLLAQSRQLTTLKGLHRIAVLVMWRGTAYWLFQLARRHFGKEGTCIC
jgi:hypothetical protein